MQNKIKLPFLTLLLMISFASVNAVLFTPALPDIANYYAISSNTAQLTISWFLIGYAVGQLLYGPLANRFGRKPALYMGISLEILSSLLCVLAGVIKDYQLLILGRFMLALGAGVGLKMTFTIVNECYEPKMASQKLSYLLIAFAITPGLGVALGGYLNNHFGWISCFYATALYGLFLLFLSTRLPETRMDLDYDALKIKHLLRSYIQQFKNKGLVLGSLYLGGGSCFVYVFAALAPFIAINLLNMNSVDYGLANLLPPIGLLAGSLMSARLVKKYPLKFVIRIGVLFTCLGTIWMLLAMLLQVSALFALFFPMMLSYFGLSMIIANSSSIAMSETTDKAHGSAVMNFLNMGLVTLVVLSLNLISIKALLLPIIYMVICVGLVVMNKSITAYDKST